MIEAFFAHFRFKCQEILHLRLAHDLQTVGGEIIEKPTQLKAGTVDVAGFQLQFISIAHDDGFQLQRIDEFLERDHALSPSRTYFSMICATPSS